MQVAGLSLERSAAAGEGQMELSCQSCMQQAVQYHITSTIPTSHSFYSKYWNVKTLLCKVILQTTLQTKFGYKVNHSVTKCLTVLLRLELTQELGIKQQEW